jgi:hypothetical protein
MAKADLKGLGKAVLEHARSGLNNAAKFTEQRLKDNVGLTDHDLLELEKLGHPYARRNPTDLHTPNWLIHRQSGDLYDSIKIVKESPDRYAIGADENLTNPRTGNKYVISIIEGTSKMVARNYPLETLNELTDSKILVEIFEKSIESALKKF